MQHVIDYLYQHDNRLISPIWDGDKAFPFLCLGHLEISQALRFETFQATTVLRQVKQHNIDTNIDLENWIKKNQFDYSYFQNEVTHLIEIKKNALLCGGGCFGPLTVVSGILGADIMLKKIIKEPEFIHKFVDYVTGYLCQLAKMESEEMQDFFWIAEPLASLLSPKKFWEFSGQYLKRIFEAAKVPGFLHVCGNTLKHTHEMVQTGAEVLSIDYSTEISKCIRMVPENVIIMGNISPSTLCMGTKDEIEKETDQMLSACENLKNYIISTGCSLMENTPSGNIHTFLEYVKKYPVFRNEEYRLIRKILETNQYNKELLKHYNEYDIPTNVKMAILKEADYNWNIQK
jgi:uroporphyrinogen decarboxylase